jgi:hypothetical protein
MVQLKGELYGASPDQLARFALFFKEARDGMELRLHLYACRGLPTKFAQGLQPAQHAIMTAIFVVLSVTVAPKREFERHRIAAEKAATNWSEEC